MPPARPGTYESGCGSWSLLGSAAMGGARVTGEGRRARLERDTSPRGEAATACRHFWPAYPVLAGSATSKQEKQEVGMTGQPGDEVVQAWNDHRPYLVDMAFRMLGDIGAAEDVVQDAFSRLLRARPGEIEDERGWLIVVTSRLCLDQIRSARARRERPHDASEIEFVPGGQASVGQQAPIDPADRVTLDDNVRLALLVVLQRLSPAERVRS